MGFGKDGKGVIMRESATITVGALASGAVVKHTGGVSLQTTSFRILKTEYFISQNAAFAAEGDEVIIGIANGALSTAEIAASVTNNGPGDRNDTPEADVSERAVFLVGPQIKETQTATTGYGEPMPNNGMPMEFSLRWTFTPTEGWDWFAFNPLSGALTTGAVFLITAKHFGVWVD